MRVLLLAIITAALPSPALTQDLNVPRLDLSGLWELTEHGVRKNNAPAIVRITHSGNTVHAAFVSGAECAAGPVRSDLFVAEVRMAPPSQTGLLSSPAMEVCSGSPEAVKQCGTTSAVQGSYKAAFTDADVKPNFIKGERFRQGYKDCDLDPSENSTADFSLRRLAPCDLEDLMVKFRSDQLSTFTSVYNAAFLAAGAAIDAARRRFGNTFQGRPIDTLLYPHETLRTAVVDSQVAGALAAAMPDVIAKPEWAAARTMADEMSILAEPPLMEAREMVEQILTVERQAADAKRAADALTEARAALNKCRLAQQR